MQQAIFFFLAGAPLLAATPGTPFGAVRFEENRGQTDRQVRYVARARGYQVFLDSRGILLAPARGEPVRVSFGGSPAARWTAAGEAVDRISYFVGNDAAKWVREAPVFERVQWRGVYPGVDLVLYGAGERLEYDLRLAPGADPRRIRLRAGGAARLRADGAIEIAGVLVQKAPVIYQQDASGRRRPVAGRFAAAGPHEFRLQLGGYDASRPLIVDPVIELLTYLGGENDDEVVALGPAFVAGNTQSVVFPETSVQRRRSRDVFIRFSGSPTSPNLTGTIVTGGSDDDELAGATGPGRNSQFQLFGTTKSRDLPFAREPYRGGASDGFAITFILQRLFGSVYIGGSGEDRITAADADASGSVCALAGVTDSPDLPVNDGGQPGLAGGRDAFYSLGFGSCPATLGYLGGPGDDRALAVAVRNFPEFLLGGETNSDSFPGATSPRAGGSDAFLARVRAFGGPPEVRTVRFGGSGDDRIQALAQARADAASFVSPLNPNWIAVAGTTSSTDFPVRNAAQTAYGGGGADAFTGIWDLSTGEFRWLTYIGGSDTEEGAAVGMNWAGEVFLGGWTRSRDLPVLAAVQPSPGGGEDGLFAAFDTDGKLRHLTYLGGSGDDRIRAFRPATAGSVRVGGSTTSEDLPTVLPWMARGGRMDGFVADIGGDYLSGPDLVVLPKDGVTGFVLRSTRSTQGVPVTYRSPDPSRVRFVFNGRAASEVTANLGNDVLMEALADNGEVMITASAPGHETKAIRVRLYPGVFVSSAGGLRLTTWSSPVRLSASYQCLDPESNRTLRCSAGLRAGAAAPVFRWTSSDPSVAEIVLTSSFGVLSASIAPRAPGRARIQLEAPGYTVWEAEPTIVTVERPRAFLAAGSVTIGKDLQRGFTVTAVNTSGASLSPATFRGTFTVRSEDPSRLLIAAAGRPAAESVTLNAASFRDLGVALEALSAEGTVRVIVSGSDTEESEILVRLEPSALRLAFGPETVRVGGSVGTSGQWVSQSGTVLTRRSSAPPVLLRLSNSNPEIVELNRRTFDLSSSESAPRGTAIAPGRAQFRVEVLSGGFDLETDRFEVEVLPPAPGMLTFDAVGPVTPAIGKDLQVTLELGAPTEEVTAVSLDPSAVLVSANAAAAGSAEARLERINPSVNRFRLTLQALKGEGEASVVVRSPGVPELAIRVTLLPSAILAGTTVGGFVTPPFERRALVFSAPLDELTLAPLPSQALRAGSRYEVALRAEGGIQLSQSSVVLTQANSSAEVSYTLPPAGQDAAVVVVAPAGFTTAPRSRLAVRRETPRFSPEDTRIPFSLSRDTLATAQVRAGTAAAPVEVTFTSTDPSRMLISRTSTSEPAESVRVTATGLVSVQLHGLAETESAGLRISSSAGDLLEQRVLLTPLVLSVAYQPSDIPVGGTLNLTYSMQQTLRPGAAVPRFSLRSSDPLVATVSPATLRFGPNDPSAVVVEVRGVGDGIARVLVDSDGPAYPGIFPVEVTVRAGFVVTSASVSIGKNLQGFAQFGVGDRPNPAGAIVTVTSQDPGRVLLSRAANGNGTASVIVAVPPNQTGTAPVYLQGIETGQATLRISGEGVAESLVSVQVVPSWFRLSLSFGSGNLIAGDQASLFASLAVPEDPGRSQLQEVRLLPAAGTPRLRASSSDPEVASLTPTELDYSGSESFRVRASRPGEALLRIEQPAGFGPAPPGADELRIRVQAPRIGLSCFSVVLGKDLQQTCAVTVPAGVTVTAVSEDPSLLLVSADAAAMGSTRATLGPSGLHLQALASRGTAEVVLSAPGYADLRVPIILRPARLTLQNLSGSSLLGLSIGQVRDLIVAVSATSESSSAVLRPGAEPVLADLRLDPPGIATLDPARVSIAAGQSSASTRIRGVAAGAALLVITSPGGLEVPAPPLQVTVR